jgi:hypothetical protein
VLTIEGNLAGATKTAKEIGAPQLTDKSPQARIDGQRADHSFLDPLVELLRAENAGLDEIVSVGLLE